MTTLEEQIREIVTRAYLAKPTGNSRAFAFMDTPVWEAFVKGASSFQAQELLSLIKSIVPEKKKEDEFHRTKQDYVNFGFNACRQQIINKIEGRI
jgi:hypothetical protein